jgi:hypothetical protein
LRTGSKFRGVGFADGNHPGLLQPLDNQAVLIGYKIFEQGRAKGGPNAFGQGQVFMGYGQTEQRSGGFVPRQSRIGGTGLAQRQFR